MCRLLYVRSEKEFAVSDHLKIFSEIARNSKEYQGHGWGCAWLNDNQWQYYKNIKPIWEDDLNSFGQTRLLLVHARSAFRDKDIVVENNMPFYDQKHVFIFNGELHGVRITAPGRIGAEKIFNFIKRFDKGEIADALEKGCGIIEKRSSYIRAMNIILADKKNAFVYSRYNEDPDYFTMWYKENANQLIICSDAYPGEEGWQSIENQTKRVF